MNKYEPLIADPAHLRSVEGQRFVVLRPDERVSRIHANAQDRLKHAFPQSPISFPSGAHVALAGFPEKTSLERVQEVVREWCMSVPPLTIELVGYGHFPSPSKIAFVAVRSTPNLFEALTSLRTLAIAKNLEPFTIVPVEEWIFHVTVAYCASLDDETWARLVAEHEREEFDPRRCIASKVEIVAYDDGRERPGGGFALRGE